MFPREKLSAPPLCRALRTALRLSTLPSRSGQSPALASTSASLGRHRAACLRSRQQPPLTEPRALPTPSHQTPRSRRGPIRAAAGARRSGSRDCDLGEQLGRVGRVSRAFGPGTPVAVASRPNWVLVVASQRCNATYCDSYQYSCF